jgi:hypothetical protein
MVNRLIFQLHIATNAAKLLESEENSYYGVKQDTASLSVLNHYIFMYTTFTCCAQQWWQKICYSYTRTHKFNSQFLCMNVRHIATFVGSGERF